MSRPVYEFLVSAGSMAGVELFGGRYLAVRDPTWPQVLFESVLTGVIVSAYLRHRRRHHPPD